MWGIMAVTELLSKTSTPIPCHVYRDDTAPLSKQHSRGNMLFYFVEVKMKLITKVCILNDVQYLQ